MSTVKTTLPELVGVIDRSFSDVFKNAIKARLRAHSENIIEEIAEEIVKDVIGKMEFMDTAVGDPVIYLKIFEKEKKFVVEKTVKEI